MTDITTLQAKIRRKQEETITLEQNIITQTARLTEVLNNLSQSGDRERGFEIRSQGNRDTKQMLERSRQLAQERLVVIREAQLNPMLGSIVVRPRLAEISIEIDRIEDSLVRETLTEREISRLRRKLEPLRAMQEVLRERISSVDQKLVIQEQSLRDKDRELTQCDVEFAELQRNLATQRETILQGQEEKERLEAEKNSFETRLIRLREEQVRLEAQVAALLSEGQKQEALQAQARLHSKAHNDLSMTKAENDVTRATDLKDAICRIANIKAAYNFLERLGIPDTMGFTLFNNGSAVKAIEALSSTINSYRIHKHATSIAAVYAAFQNQYLPIAVKDWIPFLQEASKDGFDSILVQTFAPGGDTKAGYDATISLARLPGISASLLAQAKQQMANRCHCRF